MNHPAMTSRGRRIAGLCGLLIALLLPMNVECGYPGGECATWGPSRRTVCHRSELEPFGFYLLERAFGRNVGFAYSSTVECR